jgi:hypothetical protein
MEEFENALVDIINNSTLAFEAKRYVVKHIATLMDVEMLKFKIKESEEKPDE